MTASDVQLFLTALNTLVLPAMFGVAKAWWSIEKRLMRVEAKLKIEHP